MFHRLRRFCGGPYRLVHILTSPRPLRGLVLFRTSILVPIKARSNSLSFAHPSPSHIIYTIASNHPHASTPSTLYASTPSTLHASSSPYASTHPHPFTPQLFTPRPPPQPFTPQLPSTLHASTPLTPQPPHASTPHASTPLSPSRLDMCYPHASTHHRLPTHLHVSTSPFPPLLPSQVLT